MWEPGKTSVTPSPYDVRLKMAEIFVNAGHTAILMEEDPDRKQEDMVEKFDRILHSNVTDVVLYWPPSAKMQTTFDELILLRDRDAFLKKQNVSIWMLHHSSVARITQDSFEVLETGARSRYLTAIVRLGVNPIEWDTDADLEEQAKLLAAELE
jgi:hypothetical protein